MRRLADHAVRQARRTPEYPADARDEVLHERARLVGAEAEYRLAGIQNITDLSPAQADALFGIYAGASPAYHPRMVIPTTGGEAGTIHDPQAYRPLPVATQHPDPDQDLFAALPETSPSAPLATPPSPEPFSPAYAPPTMGSSGDDAIQAPAVASPSATEQRVLDVLETDQQAALVETWEREDALWSFIVDDLNQEVDEAIDLAVNLLEQESVAEPEPAATPASGGYGGQNLRLGQPR